MANKSFGQHWLRDDYALRSMVSEANITSADSVLEIGPGLGYLTDKLLQTKATIIALEYDRELIPKLKAKYVGLDSSKLKIIEGDIRKFNFADLPANYKICANIPYYLTANLIRRLTDESNKPQKSALLVQKEVAIKLADTSKHSMLNLITQSHYQVDLGEVVTADKFEPPPKVDSMIMVLTKLKQPLVDNSHWNSFVRLVKASYSSPRKKLTSNLIHIGITKRQAENFLSKLNLGPNIRAENLSLDQWQNLYKNISIML